MDANHEPSFLQHVKNGGNGSLCAQQAMEEGALSSNLSIKLMFCGSSESEEISQHSQILIMLTLS